MDRSIYFGAYVSATLTANVQRGGHFFTAYVQAIYNNIALYVLRMKTTDKKHSDTTCGLVFEIAYKHFISVTHYGHCIIVALSGNHDSDRSLNQVFLIVSVSNRSLNSIT